MAFNFSTEAEFEHWRQETGAKFSEADLAEIRKAFRGDSENPNGNKNLACTQKPKQHWLVSLVAVFLILLGGTKMVVKGMKLMT